MLGAVGPGLCVSTARRSGGSFAGRYCLRGLVRLRRSSFARLGALAGEFTRSGHWLLMSDSMARKGNTADAAGLLRSAVREHPNNVALWVGLGNALVDHSGMLTPAAELAYRRAAELARSFPQAQVLVADLAGRIVAVNPADAGRCSARTAYTGV